MFDRIKTAFLGWIVGIVKNRILGNWEASLAGVLGAALARYVDDPATREAIIVGTVAAVGALAGNKLPKNVPPATLPTGPVARAVPEPDPVKAPADYTRG